MDKIQVGVFIAQKRKEKKLTQEDVAQKLYVSDRAVSKWERGKSLPDAAIMPALCALLGISLSELFCGETLAKDQQTSQIEDELLTLKKEKEEEERGLLRVSFVLGTSLVVFFLASLLLAVTFLEPWPWKVVFLVLAFAFFIAGVIALLWLEWKAGPYVCPHCGKSFVPSFRAVFLAMHTGTTRCLTCPHCHEKGWCKKKKVDPKP